MNTIPCNPLRPIAAAALAAGLAIVPAFILASEPPEKDREAILSMAGEFEVLFNFEETVSLQKGYTLKEPYQEDASELVLVIEDTGDRIVLQHILTTSRGIVKHWKQVWTWEDTRIVEYQGRNQWAVRELDPEEVKGTWSQLVSQVDDSPRYESYAKWRHDGGYSRWESRQTARPLPRREHTKRDDYQILQAVNGRDLMTIGFFGLGFATGILGFARVLKWLLARAHGLTMAFLVGLMAGSIRRVWPYRELIHGS